MRVESYHRGHDVKTVVFSSIGTASDYTLFIEACAVAGEGAGLRLFGHTVKRYPDEPGTARIDLHTG